jgi:hypothetical protein
VLVALLNHPFSARKMALPDPTCATGFTGGVDAQHDARYLGPIRARGLSFEESYICDGMLLVIAGENGILWSLVGYWRIDWSLRHWYSNCARHNGA